MRKPAFVGLAVVFFAAIFLVRIGEDMVDFEVNYRAAERLRRGENLYQTADGHFMFKYFPVSAMLYLPISYLRLGVAKAVWYALTVFCSVSVLVLSHRIVSRGSPRPWYVVVLPPVVLAKFFFREMKLGQVNTLVTLLLLLMLVWVIRGRRVGAGALWGVATAVKPYGLMFLPYFVVRRDFGALASAGVVLLAAFLLPTLFYGFTGNVELHRDWYLTLSQSTPGQLTSVDNVSIFSALTRWTGDAALAGRAGALVVVLLALVVLLVMLRGKDLSKASVLECALLLTLIPLVSPLGWDYQLLTSALAVTLLAHHLGEFSAPWRGFLLANLFVAGFAIYDVIGRTGYFRFMSLSVLTVNFLVVVAFLVSLRQRRVG